VSEEIAPLPAVIMAGGGADDRVAETFGAPCKALVDVAGRPMIEWVADALANAETVSGVVAVEGPTRALSGNSSFDLPIVAADETGFVDTMTAGVQALPEAQRVLVVTADLPLLTGEAVDGFIRSCQETRSALSYPVVRAERFRETFPGRVKTVARLREGHFTGGNLAIVTRRFVLEQGPTIARTFDRRKSPLGLAGIFGVTFVLRLALGLLRIEDLERRGSELVEGPVSAVPVQWPEIGFDVDHAEDLELAERFIAEHMADT
jgi:GTP:adenosylcobinamide-phosphate guanylyltransferase